MDSKLSRLLKAQQILGWVLIASVCVTILLVLVRIIALQVMDWAAVVIISIAVIALLWGQSVRRKAKSGGL